MTPPIIDVTSSRSKKAQRRAFYAFQRATGGDVPLTRAESKLAARVAARPYTVPMAPKRARRPMRSLDSDVTTQCVDYNPVTDRSTAALWDGPMMRPKRPMKETLS